MDATILEAITEDVNNWQEKEYHQGYGLKTEAFAELKTGSQSFELNEITELPEVGDFYEVDKDGEGFEIEIIAVILSTKADTVLIKWELA